MIRLLVLIVAFLASPAAAQPISYAPPDKELWETMTRALENVPMSLGAHQTVQNILSQIQREAVLRSKIERHLPPAKSDEAPK